jgi:hypothetical protein
MDKKYLERNTQSDNYAVDYNQGSRGIMWGIIISIPTWLAFGIIISKLLFK